MATKTVDSIQQADALIDSVLDRLSDWRGFWDRLSARPGGGSRTASASPILAVQAEYWTRRFDKGFRHAQETIRDRQQRREYYVNPIGALATPDFPYLYWTGHIMTSTSILGERRARSALIDTRQNYLGPLQEPQWGSIRDPAESLLQGVMGTSIWDLPALDARIDDEIEPWLEDEVLEGL